MAALRTMVSLLGLEPQEEPQPTAPRRQPPHGVGTRRRPSPLLTPRRSPSLRTRQSPSAIALFLSKKGHGKHVRREAAGLPRARRVLNATSRCNRLGSVVFTLRELRRITNNFSDDQLVGEGAFGKVYKGVLTNGDMIAVKRFASTITGLQDGQYENEARHLMRLKHPNIVQLVAYCSETEMKLVRHNGTFVRAEETERLLCLEYMPKGSLRGHLSDESSGLDWNTRYKIIEGICYGLHYLHEEWQATPIVHMDLKPANILLDDNMVPKIADFGLSRLFGEEQTRTCTRSCKGTLGYMAPEYVEKGVITKKSDIFSLGVTIIEIITGLRDYPTDETETTFQQYIDRVLNNWRRRLRRAQWCTYQDTDCQQIKKCIHIGLLCVKFDREKRPTINQIIKLLQRSDEAYQSEREDKMAEPSSWGTNPPVQTEMRSFSSMLPHNNAEHNVFLSGDSQIEDEMLYRFEENNQQFNQIEVNISTFQASQVPKVKLGDRITALQQIVSPFGKTDTASVLYEAINYIKWLHEQVQLLSDPYMKTSSSKDYNAWGGLDRKEKSETDIDLRSRGLCLVPVSCTPQLYRDNNGPDYWTPPYRSCLYR